MVPPRWQAIGGAEPVPCQSSCPGSHQHLWHHGEFGFCTDVERETFAEAVMTDIAPAGNMFFDGDWQLQLDNATCHRSVEAQHFLLENGVPSIMFQPPSSPDLNPIENVWVVLKRNIVKHECQTAAELRAALDAEWGALEPAEVAPFADSMARRVEEVIDKDGGHTKY